MMIVVIGIYGCSSNSNYYKPGCATADALCLGLALAKTIEGNHSSQKCSDMAGVKRKQCTEQVDLLKKHISDANSK